jgi:hypothetical protein
MNFGGLWPMPTASRRRESSCIVLRNTQGIDWYQSEPLKRRLRFRHFRPRNRPLEPSTARLLDKDTSRTRPLPPRGQEPHDTSIQTDKNEQERQHSVRAPSKRILPKTDQTATSSSPRPPPSTTRPPHETSYRTSTSPQDTSVKSL